ncbi:Ig-like domain-containing protein [Stigmatella aurantiaca]|uniref:Cadherin-like domain-containing protein n=1 Tax=Stigmatella aurantiaca (strain DW4/3-1) TaxID=378806 RepID=E3FWU9_STIAD|nr:uncharacterized protein STAUR_2008 [Stigmatella aurantiaca DW4/3-1]
MAYHQTVSTDQDTAKSIALTATDPAGAPHTYLIVTPPAFGTLSGTGAGVIYTPNVGFSGTDSYVFKASNGITNSNPATVHIGRVT